MNLCRIMFDWNGLKIIDIYEMNGFMKFVELVV